MTEELVTFETAKLAKEKGFDEECRNMWMYTDETPVEVNAPKDEVLIESFTAMFLNHMKDPVRLLEIITKAPKIRPLRNSTLPPPMYCRPTQDLLERWLRDKHSIMLFAPEPVYLYGILAGWTAAAIHRLKLPIDYTYPDQDTKQTETYELAREAALLHALKLLP